MTTKRTLTQAQLDEHHGSGTLYRNWANYFVMYTEGVHFLAEAGGAFWLVDTIASLAASESMDRHIEQDPRLAELQFWQLDVHEDDSATLTCRADDGVAPCITQKIPSTDFPLKSVRICGAPHENHGWVLYLPSEH